MRPAFVFLGFGASSTGAGVGGLDFRLSLNLGVLATGVEVTGVAPGVPREGSRGTPLVLSFNLMPLMLDIGFGALEEDSQR